jgi:P27 family predicted phage terminase small subunit
MPRIRKSDAQHARDGTRRADRQAPRVVRPDEALKVLPKPPAGLPKSALPHWREIGGLLVARRVLTVGDLFLLASLASTLAMEAKAAAEVERDGLTVEGATGGRKKHPAVAVIETARRDAMLMFKALGLTPTTRDQTQAAPGGGGKRKAASPPWAADDDDPEDEAVGRKYFAD